MTKRYDSLDILNLLVGIDAGKALSEEEKKVLSERKELDLRKSGIIVLPESLGLLSNLQTLNLCDTPIIALPESIGQLASLQTLDLRGTTITALPESFGQLAKLQTLDLSDTPINTLPESVGQLVNLQTLNLWNSPITALPESLGQLANLQALYLSGTGITDLPAFVGRLCNLQTLDLSGTEITNLPEFVGRLCNLQTLDLRDTRITALPESVGQLARLQTLNLSYTEITALPESVGQLGNLQTLDVSFTQITALPESIGQLANLQTLDLSYTEITALPRRLVLGALPIWDNFLDVEYGIYAADTQLPDWYFESLEVRRRYLGAEEKQGFREAKILFLGYGNAGKTYAVNRFLAEGRRAAVGEDFGGEPTHGIRICDYKYTDGSGEQYTFHLWDFGGQEMLHAMHRCFLTENAVYVLTVSSRSARQTEKLRYWLNSILPYLRRDAGSRAGERPTVFILENRWGSRGTADLDRIELMHEFKEELELRFCALSVRDAEETEFRERLMEPLIGLALAAEARALHPPVSYLRVRDRLAEPLEGAGFVEREDYLRFCKEAGITDLAEQRAMLPHFKNLGICLWADMGKPGDRAGEFRLIRPLWLTNALSAVIAECEARQGSVSRREIRRTLTNPPDAELGEGYTRMAPALRYKAADCDYILRVAAMNDLLYEDPEDPEYVFIPAMCRKKNPEEAEEEEPTRLPEPVEFPAEARFRVHYEYRCRHLPEITVQTLMVKSLREKLTLADCWRGGFVAEGINCTAAVDTDPDGRALQFKLWSLSDRHPVDDLLALYRRWLGLAGSVPKDVTESVVCGTERYSVRRLLNAERNGIERVAADLEPNTTYRVRELLGMLPEQARESYAREAGGAKYDIHAEKVVIQDGNLSSVYQEQVCVTAAPERAPECSWRRFEANFPANPQADFERLCRDLFRGEFFDDSTVLCSSPNNAGVEVEPLPCPSRGGRRISFQAKYFKDTKYDKILDSAKKTVAHYSGKIDEVLLLCNRDMKLDCDGYQSCKAVLAAAGIELTPLTNEELLARIKKHPELLREYFHG